MVLLVERIGRSLKSSFKKENHHHPSKPMSASLHAFESEILKSLSQLSLQSKPGSEILSLSWIRRCLQLIPNINREFAKLVADIDYPMSRWEKASIEEYLKDSLNLLELLNSINSSISHLGQARMTLSHALSLVEASPLAFEHLKAIQPWNSNKGHGGREEEEEEERCCSGKEWIIHQALLVKKNVGYWVCGVVESSLCGDVQSCLGMRKAVGGFYASSLISLHLGVCEEMRERKGVLKEVGEVNNVVVQFLAAAGGRQSGDKANELRGRVEVLGKLLEGVGEDVNRLFSEVLEGRNELLDSFRQRKQ